MNAFSHDEKAQPKAYALKVIRDTHASWLASHGAIRSERRGRRATSFGIMSSPSMSEMGLTSNGSNGSIAAAPAQ